MCNSLYIHIPFCLSRCKYCDFFSTVLQEDSIPEDYITALVNEIKFRLKKNNVKSLETIYIGGGTPSLLSQNQVNKIFDGIKSEVQINPDAEVTIEVNPDDVTEDLLKFYNSTSINRISCGIQSLNNSALSFCGRRADFKNCKKALDLFKKYWKKNLSLDIICGLPEETETTFIESLNTMIKYNPDHISMYSLTIEEETPLGQMYFNGDLEYSFDYSDELWLKGYDILKKNNYAQYEVSNFCHSNKECKHNLKYWNHSDYIGCGSGGTGTVYNKDGSGNRWTNKKNIQEYCNYWNKDSADGKIPAEEEFISIEDSKFEFFMMGLRKRQGIFAQEYKDIFKEDLPEKYVSIFAKWNCKGLLDINKTEKDINYSLNEKGILFLNSLLNELL